MKQRLINLFISLDQFLFCWLTLGAADPDETFSAAAWRWERDGRWIGRFWRPVIDTIFFFQPDHCYKAYGEEITHRQQPYVER